MSLLARAGSLIAPRRLLDRRRFGEARAADLGRLRARFTAQPSRGPEAAVARELPALKRAVAEAYAEARSCAGCGRGCARPAGRWPGGRCCGTSTLTVFSPLEVRAMKLAGQRAPEAAAGDAAEAGCAFRGPTGCSLAPEARPVRCLLYECAELGEEMAGNDEARARRRALAEAYERFAALASR
ncbi:MAG TPA: hypothetical protein RMH99_25415 [Sandaracinaceae bacterium LLY-WYZ-13_1]|nr:hypothetical protein [Sandaracinaceae bacterium LLY-WYZ-13_1]